MTNALADSGELLDSTGDASVVEMVRRGDRDAFGILVQRYERRLLSVLGRFVSDWDLARDLSQETFLRAFERLDQFDPSRRFGPWLFQIGVNLALDFSRKKNKKRKLWLSLFSDSRSETPPDPASADPRPGQDLAQEVRHVLAMLPEQHRTVLVLRDLENFSTSEIAAILHRKEATVRWKLSEARDRFQRLWEQRAGAGTGQLANSQQDSAGRDSIAAEGISDVDEATEAGESSDDSREMRRPRMGPGQRSDD